MKNMSTHHGEILEKVIRRTGPSLTDLAKLMNVNRRSIYNWFIQQRLKPDTILRIGRAIGHDFSVEFPELFVSDDFRVEISSETAAESKLNVWKEKYIDLLERYNFLMKLKEKSSASPRDPAFNVMFVNNSCNEYKLELNNAPSEIFIEKCKKAGYTIRGINRGEIRRERSTEQAVNCAKY
jgi:plasmid maintenance system antidote protein VapI